MIISAHRFGRFLFFSPNVIIDAFDALLPGAMGATVIRRVGFDPVPDDLASAIGANRRQKMDGAFETVENVGFARRDHFK